MIGPGKYDDLCTEAREKAQATLPVLVLLPELLRDLADRIEADAATAKVESN